jgi:hypothetical protein
MVRRFILIYQDGVPSKDEVVTRPKRLTDARKLVATIIWNPHGFHVVDLLPDGTKFNRTYLLNNIVAPLQWRISPARRKTGKTIVLSLR